MNKYINTNDHKNLSRTAHAILLPLMLLSNKNNEINKRSFTKTVSWISDYRTWNKYWKELEDKGILTQLDKSTWMVSPHECYTDAASHTALITKWNEVYNATS